MAELNALNGNVEQSRLYQSLVSHYIDCEEPCPIQMNSLLVPCIAERALVYLYAEQNLLSTEQVRYIVKDLALDREYLSLRLSDNRRPLDLSD